ncbi:DNA cytosine methyltransferase, partial [Salmonella enterica]|nr:DNA cytosine methyltransferase [Salmonella enterica]
GRICGREDSKREDFNGSIGCDGTTCGLADADNKQRSQAESAKCANELSGGRNKNSETVAGFGCNSGANAVNGFWGSADWLFCHDGKWRPVKPGLKPLVNGLAGRVGQLRAYGNAIVAPVAEAFISAYLESAQ